MKARNRIKPLLTLCCALLLVAAGVFGTLAYLTGTDTVNNTFTVGNVKITLDEAKVTTDGTPVEGADRVKTNEYHLLPRPHLHQGPHRHRQDRQRRKLRPHEGHLQQRHGHHRPVY